MGEKIKDRRIQRTQNLLQDALVSLILEKGYEAITVQDVIDRANVGRSTFYAHYWDKEDLLLSGFKAQFDNFPKAYFQTSAAGKDPAQAGKDLSLFFFRHAASHRDLFKAMIGEKGGKIILENMQKTLTDLICEHLTAQRSGQQKKIPTDLVAHFIASSYLSLLTWWLNHDLPYTAEQMDALFQQLVFPGLREILKSELSV